MFNLRYIAIPFAPVCIFFIFDSFDLGLLRVGFCLLGQISSLAALVSLYGLRKPAQLLITNLPKSPDTQLANLVHLIMFYIPGISTH